MEDNKEFLNFVFPRPSKFDWVVANISLNVDEMIEWLQNNREKANSNKGYIDFDVLKYSKDPNKFYARRYNKELPKQVTAKEHMPDRETVEQSDLPF